MNECNIFLWPASKVPSCQLTQMSHYIVKTLCTHWFAKDHSLNTPIHSPPWPIRGQYSGHVISLRQSEVTHRPPDQVAWKLSQHLQICSECKTSVSHPARPEIYWSPDQCVLLFHKFFFNLSPIGINSGKLTKPERVLLVSICAWE